jgi:hypothetical protein
MNTSKISFTLGAVLLFATGAFTGCETTDGGGTHVSNSYYGVAYNDAWYHGDYHDDGDIIVTPPPVNPPDQGLRPSHPIARPPQASRPSQPSRPSIPSRPRPSSRGGGGGRR